jgi:DNA-binding transcriptional MerR regulator
MVRKRSAPRQAAEAFVEAHHSTPTDEVFGIADLASEFGITHRAIRLYEAKGLLAPRRVAGQRLYTRRDRARLTLILRAKALGSTLQEIKAYLDLYGDHGEGRRQQLEFVIQRTEAAMAALEEKKQNIETSLAELRLIHATCVGQLEERRQSASDTRRTTAPRARAR